MMINLKTYDVIKTKDKKNNISTEPQYLHVEHFLQCM